MDSRYKIPAPWIFLKSIYDTVEEDMRGRGKTRIERYSEIKVTNLQEANGEKSL